jgi:hypothetical protein
MNKWLICGNFCLDITKWLWPLSLFFPLADIATQNDGAAEREIEDCDLSPFEVISSPGALLWVIKRICWM